MKKLFLRLSVLGFALTSAVNTNAACNTIPPVTPGFAISLTGLYLRPSANNLQYAVYTQPLPLPRPNWSQVTLKPGFSPAFNLGLQYYFPDTVNKVNLDWLHVSTSTSGSFSAQGANTSVAPPYYFGPLAQALTGTSATSRAQFNVDNIGLTFGHLINLGDHIQLDPFVGIEGAYLKENITSTYVGVDSNSAPYSITSYNTSKFTGIGPRLGINATYFVTKCFGITARFGGALLAGSMKSNTNFNSFGAGNSTPANTTLADQSQTRVVPELDSKLEINYLIPTNQCGSSVTLAAGYMLSTYINGINQVVPTSLVPGAFNQGAIAIETVGQTQSDLSLNGPYLSLVWKI